MSSTPNTKLILTGAALLVALVGCSVAVARAITNDEKWKDAGEGPLTSAKIVENIRKTMNDTSIVEVPIQAYIIPSVDAHQSEFPTARDNRVQYVSQFTGSSATIVITESGKAALWVDSRYYTQAESQIDNQTWILMKMGLPSVPTVQQWLVETLTEKSSRVGIDPYLMESKYFHHFEEFLELHGHKLVALQPNLVDLVWKNRPELILKDLEPIEKTFSGKKIAEKLKEVREILKNVKADSLLITSLEDIAWLLNLRGSDFEYTPLFFAYGIVTEETTYLYMLKQERITTEIDNHFQTDYIDIKIHEYNETMAGINTVIRNTKGKMLLSSASEAIASGIPPDRRLEAKSPILSMRIIKNDVEAKGIREAHRRDGAAIIKYLYWLTTEIDNQNITETKGAAKLKSFRKVQENYRGLSFPTISAVGPHAAMAYYTPTTGNDKQITRREIYLFNAGTHYKDGTTDITRTVHFGNPTEKEKETFTRVLKGFISVATAVFPPSAPFSFFDAMARRSLWDIGLDYSHATGHGIGAYLNVHEFPPKLSNDNFPPGMRKNMFTTNEPGYYEDGQFGVRIENVIQTVELPESSTYFGGRGAYSFHDVTMVPIQTKLIDVDLLTESEINWLNSYHVRVRNNISPLLSNDSNIIEWLEKETQPISKRIEQDCKEHSTEDTLK